MEVLLIPDIKKKNMVEWAIDLNNIIDPSDVRFDFGEVKWVEPFGMLYAGMLIRNYSKKNPNCAIVENIDQDSDPIKYAGHMGFFKFISENINIGKIPGEATGNDNYIPISRINFQEEYQEFSSNGSYPTMLEVIENKSKKLSKIISHSDDTKATPSELEIVLTYCLREMIRNISEHSEAKDAWVCGQYWPNKAKAEIAIVDEGIGLKDSLCKNRFHREYIHNDQDALQYAVKPGISRAFSPTKKNKSDAVDSNSGYGLYMTSTLCQKLGGKFYLASGDKCLIIDEHGTNFYDTKYQGVAIGLELPTNDLKNVKGIITEISREGEKKAKIMRNAFTNASKTSKGLIIPQNSKF